VIPLVDPISLLTWIMQTNLASPMALSVRSRPAPAGPSYQPTVLVVDDSIHARRYLVLTLSKAGYRTAQAKDGYEALDELNGSLDIDAVVCDVEMPRMDGYGVLDAVKSQLKLEQLPVIMVTSRSSPKHRKLAMNLGASAYFSKPYNEQELLGTLEHLTAATSLKN